jgi:exodeoxyribonuclease I
MSFVFYDTETTGTNKIFDQILQFAAIRTDEDFEELDQLDLRCQLLPHVVPSPEAMRVTGVTAAQLLDQTLPTHYAMVRAIMAKLLSWSPALYVGYNSMEFDEHLLRQALYQTLHLPYFTNTDNNCRADALRLARMVALFAPDVLKRPVDGHGNEIFKLQFLAPINGFELATAHDALADVHATIFLCKLACARAPEIWSNFVRFTQKAAVIEFANEERIFCLSDFYHGAADSWLVTSLGPAPSRSNELLVFDLAANPDELRDLKDSDLTDRLAESPKIVRKVRANACPIIMPAEDAPDMVKSKDLGASELNRRVDVLQRDFELKDRLVGIIEATRRQYDPWPHVEQKIHEAFIGDPDKARLLEFHEIPWEGRLALLNSIEDRRLRQLGRRLIYLERPDTLPPDLVTEMNLMVAQRMIHGDGRNSWLCLEPAIRRVDELISDATDDQVIFLSEHRQLLTGRLAELNSYLA